VTRIRAEKEELNRERKRQISELRTEYNKLKAELDRIHSSLPYRIYAKMFVPVRNIFRK
jgi:hypothetical protein